MKKTKFKQRIENAVDAFFADENSFENTSISFANEAGVLRKELSTEFSAKADVAFTIFKQIFLFLPGAFVLFFLSVAFTGFLISRQPLGAGNHLYFGLSVMAVSALITFLGLGDWRKPKHLLIPLSIVCIGAILGIVGSFFYGLGRFIFFVDNYAVYFFPLALIVPILVKDWVNKTDKLKN